MAVSAEAGEPEAALSSAPTGPTVLVGSRVRILTPRYPEPIRGLILAMDGTTLNLTTDDHLPVTVPADSISGLEVSAGRKRQTQKGLAIGVLVGAALFALLPLDEEYCEYSGICSRGHAIAIGALSGGLWGAGIGALIKTDRWVPASIPGWTMPAQGTRVGFSLRPTRGPGAAAAISVTF
jgi:hypothetical protein